MQEDKKIDSTLEELTTLLLKEEFKVRQTGKETMLVMSKRKLIEYCIKLVKIIKKGEN